MRLFLRTVLSRTLMTPLFHNPDLGIQYVHASSLSWSPDTFSPCCCSQDTRLQTVDHIIHISPRPLGRRVIIICLPWTVPPPPPSSDTFPLKWNLPHSRIRTTLLRTLPSRSSFILPCPSRSLVSFRSADTFMSTGPSLCPSSGLLEVSGIESSGYPAVSGTDCTVYTYSRSMQAYSQFGLHKRLFLTS